MSRSSHMLPSRLALALGGCVYVLSGCVYDLGRNWADGSAPAGDLRFGDTPDTPDVGVVIPDVLPLLDKLPGDTLPGDSTVDSTVAPTPPCAKGDPKQTYDADMVICAGASEVTQCDADQACNTAGGWKLCTASQFLARGGKNEASSIEAWIGGCMRSGGAPHAPVDGVCGSCKLVVADDVDLMWPCPPLNGSGHANSANLGIVTYNVCLRLGENVAATEGMWFAGELHKERANAVCCR